ncbi:partial Transcriptional regulatory protein DegU, partial [Gammaproteobacteria bacterium]
MTVRILLADDHKMMRQALRVLLSSDKNVAVVAEADDGREVLEKIDEAVPDVVVMDVNMPNL